MAKVKSKKASLKKKTTTSKKPSKVKATAGKGAGKKKAPAKSAARTVKKTAAVKKKSTPKKAANKKTPVKKTVKEKAVKAKAAPNKASAKKASAKKAPPKKPVSTKTAPASQEKDVKKKSTGAERSAAVKVAPSRASKSSGKILSRKFLFELCNAIKEVVEPVARAVKGREVVSESISGDVTFELDRLAEKALLMYLKSARAPVAYYSEAAGYSTFSNVQPKHLLVVDPIDGTRAAKNGYEGCVIAIASTRTIERPTMADVDNGCVMEILGDRTFYAERGGGARYYVNGHLKRPKLSENEDLESLSWSMTVPARPAELIFPTAARLIDLSSLKGGFFACNSTSFSLTRLLSNQQDACVDFAGRFLRDIPGVVRDYFINAGRGAVLGIAPYDMAAALLIAEEAGCIVTDAYGKNFSKVLLLDSSENNHQSLIAASNPALHKKLMSFFDTRIKQFEALLKRRAQAMASADEDD
jgi:myo-inositol-1(or 4)-monophosphatase